MAYSSGGGRRAVIVALVDMFDTLKPPGLDALMIIVAGLGATLVIVQPFTSPSYMLSYALDPTLFAATIFLALRGAAGITGLVESGVMQAFLSYPLSRTHIAAALYASRILAPSIIILGAPTATIAIAMWPLVSQDPAEFIATYAAYLAQALMYGSVFMLIALISKTPGTSGVLSVAFYFAYTVLLGLLLYIVGRAAGVELLQRVAEASYLPGIALIYYGGGSIEIWQPLMVPFLLVASLAVVYLYFTRRFEP
ncbi:MAG: hypothetical protein F7C09_00440 [Aeropyrum sp.]|nr:hypothetical protein [Aeropyrum sp.]